MSESFIISALEKGLKSSTDGILIFLDRFSNLSLKIEKLIIKYKGSLLINSNFNPSTSEHFLHRKSTSSTLNYCPRLSSTESVRGNVRMLKQSNSLVPCPKRHCLTNPIFISNGLTNWDEASALSNCKRRTKKS